MWKIKNTEGSAMSVGLLVVRLKFGLYVGQLSKWFALLFCLSLVRLFVVCTVVIPLAITGRGLAQAGIFTTKPATKPNTSNLRKTVKRSTEPPLAPNRCWQFVVFIRFSHLLFESKLNASVVVFTKLICPFLLLS